MRHIPETATTLPQPRPRARVCVPQALVEAVSSGSKVSGAPHDFYRYPARFSPAFAREAIRAFSDPGDLVIDPFCGGGTTLVEAMALGRRASGMDVSSLASFLTRVKTTPLSVHDRKEIEAWVECLEEELPYDCGEQSAPGADTEYYEKNLPEEARVFFRWTTMWIAILPRQKQQMFVRLILLSTGQWGFDCKTRIPSERELRDVFCLRLRAALTDFSEFVALVAKENCLPRCRIGSLRRIINRSSEECGHEGRIPKKWLPARLVLTSPPYPGVHVVYHRWQILGRRETPAPFLLANQRDGAGESHYLLGPRDEAKLVTYYSRLKSVFSSLTSLIDCDSIVVQLVAFSDPTWQLDAYIETMQAAGFDEVEADGHEDAKSDGRIWRQVPGRKWYAINRGEIPASKEVLLLHKLSV